MKNVKTLNSVYGERDKTVRITFNPLLSSRLQGYEACLIYV